MDMRDRVREHLPFRCTAVIDKECGFVDRVWLPCNGAVCEAVNYPEGVVWHYDGWDNVDEYEFTSAWLPVRPDASSMAMPPYPKRKGDQFVGCWLHVYVGGQRCGSFAYVRREWRVEGRAAFGRTDIPMPERQKRLACFANVQEDEDFLSAVGKGAKMKFFDRDGMHFQRPGWLREVYHGDK